MFLTLTLMVSRWLSLSQRHLSHGNFGASDIGNNNQPARDRARFSFLSQFSFYESRQIKNQIMAPSFFLMKT